MELKLEGLTKDFQAVRAVDHISYAMGNGVYGLLGVNGAGKTTLMRMMCTLLKPSEGRIACDGADIFEMGPEYRKLLGYLPQEFGFYPDFTVRDYLFYIASIKGLHSAVARRRVPELLESVGLRKVQNRKMRKLSGGMKRRAGIAQAMLNDPKILILDEPTAGLDPSERIRFRNLISGLAQDRLVLLSTHIVSDVESIAGEILLMRDGRIIHAGTAEEITAQVPVKAWRLTAPQKEAAEYMRRYQVANVRTHSGGTELQILAAERPALDAAELPLDLENVFLYYFGEKAGEEDVLV